MGDPLFFDLPTPPTRYWEVHLHPARSARYARERLSHEHDLTLTLAVIRLRYCADRVDPRPGSNVRILAQSETVLLGDGGELAPLEVHFTLDEATGTAWIVEVVPLESSGVRITATSFIETVVVVVEHGVAGLRV